MLAMDMFLKYMFRAKDFFAGWTFITNILLQMHISDMAIKI